MKLAGAIALLALTAGGAAALTPPPPCYFDYATGRLVSYEDAGPSMGPIYLREAGTGFASWEVYNADGSPERVALQHCPSGTDLMIVMPRYNFEQVQDRYEDMVYGPGRYTMRRVAEELEMLGAGVARTKRTLGSCACDLIEPLE
ncbi:hypothetical protein P1J78_00705 [Psychromarinibacter sp. C21-152]|uniref:Uncharacterized protein n=1 Tax=Psychromarinibacter sediminicola TaxID=3033385 RepID=A0AAE3NJZ2_9RHOB|nr:hypothetical protein [Psychromarinibacter sediminicola]MDF0599238.1 hypothetical protein [Psychromarinibacter sediminicola]